MERWIELLLKNPQYPFFALIGLGFLCYPLHAKREKQKTRRRRTATATGVIRNHKTRAQTTRPGFQAGGVSTLHPVVEFEVNGETCQVTSEVGASWNMVREGQQVKVRYNPDDPQDAEIDDIAVEAAEQFLLLIFPLIGLGLFIWGCVNFFRQF